MRRPEHGEGRDALARALQRGEPPVRPERSAAQHQAAVERADGGRVLELHVLDPGHLQERERVS
jgi:hypothetical protein